VGGTEHGLLARTLPWRAGHGDELGHGLGHDRAQGYGIERQLGFLQEAQGPLPGILGAFPGLLAIGEEQDHRRSLGFHRGGDLGQASTQAGALAAHIPGLHRLEGVLEQAQILARRHQGNGVAGEEIQAVSDAGRGPGPEQLQAPGRFLPAAAVLAVPHQHGATAVHHHVDREPGHLGEAPAGLRQPQSGSRQDQGHGQPLEGRLLTHHLHAQTRPRLGPEARRQGQEGQAGAGQRDVGVREGGHGWGSASQAGRALPRLRARSMAKGRARSAAPARIHWARGCPSLGASTGSTVFSI